MSDFYTYRLEPDKMETQTGRYYIEETTPTPTPPRPEFTTPVEPDYIEPRRHDAIPPEVKTEIKRPTLVEDQRLISDDYTPLRRNADVKKPTETAYLKYVLIAVILFIVIFIIKKYGTRK